MYRFQQNLALVCDTWNNYLPAVRLEPKAAQPFFCSSYMADDGTEQHRRWGEAPPEGAMASVAQLTQGARACLRNLPQLAQSMLADWYATSVMPWPRCCQPAPLLSRASLRGHPAAQLSPWEDHCQHRHRSVRWWCALPCHRATQKRALVDAADAQV